MSLPVIAIVGYSRCGKTPVATTIIQTLVDRGYRVAAVKHCHHGHQPTMLTKDSDLLFASGASLTFASSPGLISTVREVDDDLPLEEIVASINEQYDLVVAEGYKASTIPKVLVLGPEPVWPLPESVIAVVGDQQVREDLPAYSFRELDRLADQIEKEVIQRQGHASRVSLTVDGVPIPLSRFASRA